MYGLWLYKELKTEYGHCKVEVFRKGYTASAVEIGGFVGKSLNLALENLDTITAPIGKSVCSFSIYDTDQVEYDDLFTPDATAYKVVVSTKVDGGAYVTRWSGYITPDFFAENLSYRTPISISARDNIGYLNDVDFDLDTATITVRELIQAAFNRIAEDYPMSLSFVSQKQTAEGILAIDATISTYLLREMSWHEALETILHDLGLQMRWVDNNTIAVLDVSQLGENFGIQRFNFIERSGYREILPAWRELAQEQSYGVLDNFYKGQIDRESKLEYAANSAINTNILLYQPKAITQWSRQGEVYFLNFYNSYNAEIDDDKQDSIFITGIAPTVTNAEVLEKKMVYSQAVTEVDKQIKMTFNLNDTLRTPLSSQYSRGERNTLYLPYSQSSGTTMLKTPRPYQLKYRFNIFLRANDGTNYVMREDWVEESALAEQPFIEFLTDKLQTVDTGVTDGQGNHRFAYSGYNNSKEYSITIGSIPKAGTLEFVVYPWTFEKDDYSGARDTATYQRGAKISDIVFSVQVGKTGVETKTQVGVLHNIAEKVNYSFGQVPQREGDVITYAGGLFKSDTITALQGFKRNVDSTTYPLLELVGREIIHFNKKNYNKLSGTIKNLAKEPLRFDKVFIYKGKNYLPFACSLDVISNEMNVTTMQEVEPYATHSFVEIKSELVTGGGATVSGGNNTALQYSAEVGNAKRISELNNASESEKKESYIIVDNASWNESKKVPLSEMEGLNEAELTEFLTANEYATQPWVSGIAKGLADDIANRVLVADFEKLEGTVNGNYQSINILNGKVGTLEGYFTKGVANDSAKLGGQLPSHYATASALGTTNDNLSALTTRVGNAEGAITTLQNTYVDKTSAQTITGVKTFQNGLKIGDIKLEWDSANQALKIIGNAYVTELFSMGGVAEGGSGGGAASAAVRIMLGETPYDAVNGVVNLPAYPSLSGYATESWVNNKGYITGITSAMVTTALGYTPYNSTNPSGYITSAALNGYATESWVGANYLGLGGGELNMPTFGNFIINSEDASVNRSAMVFRKNGENKAQIGWDAFQNWGTYIYNYASYSVLGIKDDGTPHYNGNTLIHSGNIGSQSVSYANNAGLADYSVYTRGFDYTQTQLDLNNLSRPMWWWYGQSNSGLVNTPYAYGYGGGITFKQLNVSSLNGQFAWDVIHNDSNATNSLWFRTSNNLGWGNWKQLAFTDSNVASADYATNADTLDGYHADGFAMSVGSSLLPTWINCLGYGYGHNDWPIYGPALTFGVSTYYARIQKGYNDNSLYLSGWSSELGELGWRTFAFEDSNVASATKLQTGRYLWGAWFDGSADVGGGISDASSLEFNSVPSYAGHGGYIDFHFNGSNADYTSRIIEFSSGRLTINDVLYVNNGSNVLIGTNTDNGGKLQVDGNIHIKGKNQKIELTNGMEYARATVSLEVYESDYAKIQTSLYGYDYLCPLALNPNGGNVLIGTTDDNGAKLQVNGGISLSNTGNKLCGLMPNNAITSGGPATDIWLYNTTKVNLYGSLINLANNTTIAGNLTVSGGATFGGDVYSEGTIAMAKLASSSDRKLKDNIADVSAEQSMGIIRQLRPTTWDWKKDGKKSYGLIAQEVESIVPEMVSSLNDTLRLEYNQLHAFEIGAIQHIDNEVEQLKRDLKTANNKIEVLENQLNEYRRNAQWQ